MKEIQRARFSGRYILAGVLIVFVALTVLSVVAGKSVLKTKAETATAQWDTRIAEVQGTAVARVGGTVTGLAQSAETAQAEMNIAATGYALASATQEAAALQTLQAQATNKAREQETKTAEERLTVIARAETRAASRIRKTVTAQYQETYVARIHWDATATVRAKKTATARGDITATAYARKVEELYATETAVVKRQGTATTKAWKTAIASSNGTAVASVNNTATAIARETAVKQVEQGTWLVVEVDRVTVFSEKQDGFDGDIEFVMYMVVSDGESGTSLSYPQEGGAIDVLPGVPFRPGKYALAIDEDLLTGDRLDIYMLAMDVDDQSLDESIPWTLFEETLRSGVIKYVRLGVDFVVDDLVDWVNNYFNLIGEGRLYLYRSQNWQAGRRVRFSTEGREVEIEYRIHLLNKLPDAWRDGTGVGIIFKEEDTH